MSKRNDKSKLHDFKYTQEQAEKIQKGDNEAINKFWNDNYETIYYIVKSYYNKTYLGRGTLMLDLEDFIDQVYLDLPYLNYENQALLSYSLRVYSLNAVDLGGLDYLKRTSQKLLSAPKQYNRYYKCESLTYTDDETGEELNKLDLYYSDISAEKAYFLSQRFGTTNKILHFVSNFLSPAQVDSLKYILSGYSSNYVNKYVHKGTCQFMRRKLIFAYPQIKDFLLSELDYHPLKAYDEEWNLLIRNCEEQKARELEKNRLRDRIRYEKNREARSAQERARRAKKKLDRASAGSN